MESTLGYSEYDEAWFTEPTDSMASYYERLQNNVELALKPLVPYLVELNSIKSYSDLLMVDNELLKLMESFEMARVELNEGYDEGVLARTGGHHKEYLDLYQDAIRGRDTPRTGCICLSGDSFDIPPIQIISAYLHDKKKMPSL